MYLIGLFKNPGYVGCKVEFLPIGRHVRRASWVFLNTSGLSRTVALR